MWSTLRFNCRLNLPVGSRLEFSTLLALCLLIRSVAILVQVEVPGYSNEIVDNVEGDGISNSNLLFLLSFSLVTNSGLIQYSEIAFRN